MKKLSLFLFMVLFALSATFAQRTVTGSVIDEEGEPLIGASILVKGTSSGTVTDLDGNFSVEVPDGSNVLIISYTGFGTQEITLSSSNSYSLIMVEETKIVGEVIVTGFRTQLVKEVTSSISSIKAEEIGDTEADRIAELLASESVEVLSHFVPAQESEQPEPDLAIPTIRISSFVGCKGLSAGHVFIVGLNEGEMPNPSEVSEIPDIECGKFIVALTRTRKSLYLLSNKLDYKPMPGKPSHKPSIFIRMIPPEFRRDGGNLRATEVNAFLNAI